MNFSWLVSAASKTRRKTGRPYPATPPLHIHNIKKDKLSTGPPLPLFACRRLCAQWEIRARRQRIVKCEVREMNEMKSLREAAYWFLRGINRRARNLADCIIWNAWKNARKTSGKRAEKQSQVNLLDSLLFRFRFRFRLLFLFRLYGYGFGPMPMQWGVPKLPMPTAATTTITI